MVRDFLDIIIFMSKHVLLTGGVLFVLMMATRSVLGLESRFRNNDPFHSASFIHIPMVLFSLVFLSIGFWYIKLQGYAGEVEPMISSVSWLMSHGQPLYHELNAPTRYSVLYGPSVYLTNGLFLELFQPDLLISKLPSLLVSLLSLVFIYGAVARSKVDPFASLAVLMAVMMYWCQGFSIYLVRPDAYLVFALSFALLGLRKTKGLLGVVALGVALGYALNLKIHAGLYFLPVLVLFHQQNGWRMLLASLVFATSLVFAPFLLHPQISGINYLLWLRTAMGHGLCTDTLLDTTRYALVLLLPLVLLIFQQGEFSKIGKKERVLYLSLLLALGGSLLLSAKPGAGLVHLLPMVPVMIFVTAIKAQNLEHFQWSITSGESSRMFMGRMALLALWGAIMISGSTNIYRTVRFVAWQNRNSSELVQDIENIMKDFPDLKISMACGGEDEFFRNTWVRPLLVFANNPVLIDPIAVMDCSKAGLEISPQTFNAIKSGMVGVWLVPINQKPFQKTNWYEPHEGIFSETFLDYFAENYSRRANSRFFDLWFWNGLDLSRVVPSHLAGGGGGVENIDGKLDQ